MPTDPKKVPAEPWNEDERETYPQTLGPVGVEDAFFPFQAILGTDVFILANDRYALEGLEGVQFSLVPPNRISTVLRTILLNQAKVPVSAMISDGNTNHAVAPDGITPGDPGRLIYVDPWNVKSFLEEGNNIAGVHAHKEGKGRFSISWAEYERVIVAQGMPLDEELPVEACPLTYEELRSTDFWKFFHVHEAGPARVEGPLRIIPLKTGGFQEFVGLEFSIGPQEQLHGVRLRLDRKWIHEMGINPFALDIAKSLLLAAVPQEVDFSKCGVPAPSRFPNPDLRLAHFIATILYELTDQGKTRERFSRTTRTLDLVSPLILSYVAKQDTAFVPLLFSKISGTNYSDRFHLDWTLY
jgi:hypothetical protein